MKIQTNAGEVELTAEMVCRGMVFAPKDPRDYCLGEGRVFVVGRRDDANGIWRDAPAPPTCDATRCRWCRGAKDTARPLTTEDLTWYFGEGEAALSAPSSQSAFESMLLLGPPTHGGRSNGVEARAVEAHRLAATGRHRCLRTRLAGVAPAVVAVLRAAYGPTDWTRSIDEPQARAALERALKSIDTPSLKVLPLTPRAQETATRRQTTTAPARPRKASPSRPGRPSAADNHERLREWLQRQPGLANSPTGVVLGAVIAGGPALATYAAEARQLIAAARIGAGITEPQASHRVRAVQLVTKPRPSAPAPVAYDAPDLLEGTTHG